MAKKEPKSKSTDAGSYVWRGGQKIEIQKEDDRFTVLPSSPEHLERLRQAPGVRAIKPVTNQVFKVETTATERDTAMSSLRSEAYQAIVHHAYRPKEGEGTVYYLTDTIIVCFDAKATSKQIDKLLEKYGLRVLKEYDELAHTYLLQVTASSGENPIKVANRLAEEPMVASAEPNMVNRFQPAFIPPDGLFKRQWHLMQRLVFSSLQMPRCKPPPPGIRLVANAASSSRLSTMVLISSTPIFEAPARWCLPGITSTAMPIRFQKARTAITTVRPARVWPLRRATGVAS